MLSLEEREVRRKQIGASEVYKLFNFDSQEAQDLWELKIGLQDYQEIDNDAITAGNILEEECLKYYEKVNNVKLIYNSRIYDNKVDGLVVSLDAFIPDENMFDKEKPIGTPVENKVINERTWQSWIVKRGGNAEYDGLKLSIPKSYYYQLQTQMFVLKSEKGILNVNTLTDEEQEDPINVIITPLHNKQIWFEKNNSVQEEIYKRVSYMLYCMKYKKRPSELEYLEGMVF